MDAYNNAFGGTHSAPKKRILFVVTQSELGGAQQFILQFIKQLEKNAYNIAVAVGADGDGSLIVALTEIGIPIFKLSALKRNISPISDLLAIGQIKKLIREFKPDTLFLGSSKAGFIGALAAKFTSYHLPVTNKLDNESLGQLMENGKWKMRPRVVYRIGGWTFNDPWPAWKKLLWQFLEKISAPWKDIIIVNNAPDLAQAQEMGIKPRQNIVLVHNGLDPYKINFLSKDEARTQLGLTRFKKIVGTIANFYPAKGLEYLVESVTKVNREDVVWCIIGDGADRPALEKLIRDKDLTEKVLLIGRKESAVEYLNAFDLFVLPSVKEGFPWAVLEAMAAKLPVIATRVGAIPEIIEDGVSGYIVEPRNSDQIAEQVITLLSSNSKAMEMGIQAHQRVLFAFNIDTTIHQIEKLL